MAREQTLLESDEPSRHPHNFHSTLESGDIIPWYMSPISHLVDSDISDDLKIPAYHRCSTQASSIDRPDQTTQENRRSCVTRHRRIVSSIITLSLPPTRDIKLERSPRHNHEVCPEPDLIVIA